MIHLTREPLYNERSQMVSHGSFGAENFLHQSHGNLKSAVYVIYFEYLLLNTFKQLRTK